MHPGQDPHRVLQGQQQAWLVRAHLVHVPGVRVSGARGSGRSAGDYFFGFNPAVSDEAAKRIRAQIRSWRLHLRSESPWSSSPGRSTRSCGAGSTTTGGSIRPRWCPASTASTTTWCGGSCKSTSGSADEDGARDALRQHARLYPGLFAHWSTSSRDRERLDDGSRVSGDDHARLYVQPTVMLRTALAGRVSPAQRGFCGDAFNIIVAVRVEASRIVFCDPTGGSDGQAGVGPGGVGTVGAVCGGV